MRLRRKETYAQIRAYAVHYCTIALNFEEVFNGASIKLFMSMVAF